MYKENLQFRIYLTLGLMMTFFLAWNITFIYAQEKSPATTSSKQQEPGDIKLLPAIQLDFRLVGTIIAGEENSYAVIMDEKTGKQGMYKIGASINEATVLKIDKESIIVEKEKRIFLLRIAGGNYAADGSPAIGTSEELPFFEPVFSKTGPPVDPEMKYEDLPEFEPIESDSGPPVDPEMKYEDLPEFEPIESDSGPPGM